MLIATLLAVISVCAASNTSAISADEDGNLLVTSAEGKSVLLNGYGVVRSDRFETEASATASLIETLDGTVQAQVAMQPSSTPRTTRHTLSYHTTTTNTRRCVKAIY